MSNSAKIRRVLSLPTVLIDPSLVKSVSEPNKKNSSLVGEMFGIRTPNQTEVDPIPLPTFTPEEKPEKWDLKVEKGEVDLKTPLKELIQPRQDLLRTPEQITAWFYKSYSELNAPAAYVGREGNTDSPDLYTTADLRVLIVRLSTYDSVNGSMTHGALAQMTRQAAREGGFKVFVDHAYMPTQQKDCAIFRENKVPWLFGRSSKRHPLDFDVILVSMALTLETVNLAPALIWSGIAPFTTMRRQDKVIGDPEGYPIVLMGGVVSDFVESLYGPCAGEECIPDITIVGDGEYTLPQTLNLLHDCKSKGKTKQEFFRLGHDLPKDSDFERDSKSRGKYSWWYQPTCYCVGGDTRVLTEQGSLKVKELVGSRGVVLTEKGPNVYHNVLSRGLRKTFQVKTRTGNRIQVTDNHRFLVPNLEGIWEWKEVKDLKVGDKILGKLGDADMIPESKGYSEEDWFLLGHLYGDGWRVQNGQMGFMIAEGEDELFDQIRAILKRKGVKFSVKLDTPEKFNQYLSRRGVVSKKYVRSLFTSERQLPVLGTVLLPYERKGNWRSKGVPPVLWSQGKRQIISFLRALFNTDGSVQGGQANLVTRFEHLALDVQRLLRLLGITSTVCRRKHFSDLVQRELTSWVVQTRGTKARIRFIDLVGFSLTVKQRALEEKRSSTHVPRKQLFGSLGVDKFFGIPNCRKWVEMIFPLRKDPVWFSFEQLEGFRKRIQSLGMSQIDLAGRMGVDPSNLSKQLRGLAPWPRKQLAILGNILEGGKSIIKVKSGPLHRPEYLDYQMECLLVKLRRRSNFIGDSSIPRVVKFINENQLVDPWSRQILQYWTHDLYFDEVKSIVEGEDIEVFDFISVEETHSYVSDGLVSHNCHIYDEQPDPKTGYRELRNIVRKPECDYAAAPGLIKRAVVRDLDKTQVWDEAPLQWMGCYIGSTRILTPEGYIQLKDYPHSEGVVLTEYGPKVFHGVKSQGLKKTLKIQTRLGNRLQVTPNHKFKVALPDGNWEWREAHTLTSGDYILGRLGDANMIPESRGEDPDIWFLAGFLYGDGSRTKCQKGKLYFLIAEGEDELLNEVSSRLKRFDAMFSVFHLSVERKKRHSRFNVTKYQNRIATSEIQVPRLSKILPPYESKSGWRKKGVPPALWTQGKRQIIAFLNGLFTTDGCVLWGQATLTTLHKQLAIDTQQLLRLLGIASVIYRSLRWDSLLERERKVWEVKVTGTKSKERFKSSVGFSLKAKQEALERDAPSTNTSHKKLGKVTGSDRFLGIPYAGALASELAPRREMVMLSNEERQYLISELEKRGIRRRHLANSLRVDPSIITAGLNGRRPWTKLLLQQVVQLLDDGQIDNTPKPRGFVALMTPCRRDKRLFSLLGKLRVGQRHLLPDSRVKEFCSYVQQKGLSTRLVNQLLHYQQDDLYFDRVVSVKDAGEAEVFDALSVEDTYSYIGDGIVSHNSLGNSADIQISAGCCYIGSRVITTDGIYEIQDLVGLNLTHRKILTEFGPRDFSGVKFQGKKPAIEIEFYSGHKILVSKDHRFKVQNNDNLIDWKYVRDITPGDYVLSQRGDHNIMPDSLSLDSPELDDPNLWFSVGWVIGDGYLEKDTVAWVFAEGEEDVRDRVIRNLESRKIPYKLQTRSPSDTTFYSELEEQDITIQRTKSLYILKAKDSFVYSILGPYLPKGGWRANGLPKILNSLGKKQIASFVSALFGSDGSTHKNHQLVNFTSKFRSLCSDLQFYLRLLGINSHIIEAKDRADRLSKLKKVTKYDLYLVGTNAYKLFCNVGMGSDRKNEDLVRVQSQLTKAGNDKCYGWPNSNVILKRLFPKGKPQGAKKSHTGRDISVTVCINRNRISTKDTLITDNVLPNLIQRAEQFNYDSEALRVLKEFTQNNWYFEEVRYIKDVGEKEVYDPVNVQGTASYVVEGLVSHNCLCVAGDTVIETDQGFETIKDAYDRLQDENQVAGVLVQTRRALQGAEKIVYTGKKKVRTFTFHDDTGENELVITCTDEHRFDTAAYGDSEPTWTPAGKLEVGQEVVSTLPDLYFKSRNLEGKINDPAQHYYASTTTLELHAVSDYFETDCYDIVNCDVQEYIANGLIVHNSGGLCSFCLAEGTLVTIRGQQVPIETLEDLAFEGDPDDREFDTPYGLQVPDGVLYTGEKECITLTTKGGLSLTCTPEHLLLTHRQGKVQLVKAGELLVSKDVLIPVSHITNYKPARDSGQRDFLYPQMAGSRAQQKEVKKTLEAVADSARRKGENADQAVLAHEKVRDTEETEQKNWLTKLRKANAYDDLIIKVEPAGVRRVYDVWNISKGHVFYANGLVVSNCHSPETPVVMSNGQTKPISEIQPGQAVITHDGRIRPVVNVFVREVDEEVALWQAQGMSDPIRSTLNHHFPAIRFESLKSDLSWDQVEELPLSELKVGDFLVGPLSTPELPDLVQITLLDREHYTGPVFNLEIGASEHSYRVGETTLPENVTEIWQELMSHPELRDAFAGMLET